MLQWGRANDGAEIINSLTALATSSAGFNGAAPMMARKYAGTIERPERGQKSFNGAAPMMARKSPRARNGSGIMTTLQWGRANDGAEISARDPEAGQDCRFNGAAPMMARKSWPCAGNSTA